MKYRVTVSSYVVYIEGVSSGLMVEISFRYATSRRSYAVNDEIREIRGN